MQVGLKDIEIIYGLLTKHFALILSQAPSYCALVGVFDHCQLSGNDFRANEVQPTRHFQG